jgi:XTP/dITP diphosphohydrolase
VILLLGTKNEGKIRELLELLADLSNVELLTFHDRPFQDVEEAGGTFRENATLKARTICAETGLPVLSEDAGLEVAALGGEPGVRSARYASDPPDYRKNNKLLLRRLTDIQDRRARFVAVVALCLPDGRTFTRTGILHGGIAEHPTGTEGFGYDPLFIPRGNTRTLAEMSLTEKNRISHRRKAIVAIKGVLRQISQR